jgi:hypothetical protein
MGSLEKEPPADAIRARLQVVANYMGTWAEGFNYFPVTDPEEQHSVFFVYGIKGDLPGAKLAAIQNRFPGATVRVTSKGTRVFIPKDETRFRGFPLVDESVRAKTMPVGALVRDLAFYLAAGVLILYALANNTFGLFGA